MAADLRLTLLETHLFASMPALQSLTTGVPAVHWDVPTASVALDGHAMTAEVAHLQRLQADIGLAGLEAKLAAFMATRQTLVNDFTAIVPVTFLVAEFLTDMST